MPPSSCLLPLLLPLPQGTAFMGAPGCTVASGCSCTAGSEGVWGLLLPLAALLLPQGLPAPCALGAGPAGLLVGGAVVSEKGSGAAGAFAGPG